MARVRTSKRGSIERLDKNFQAAPAAAGLCWVDAFDKRFSLRGLGWPSGNHKRKDFRRVSELAAGKVSDAVRVLSAYPAGVFLGFFSDSRTLSVRMEAEDTAQMWHMPATGMAGAELYFREDGCWHPMATARASLDGPKSECVLFQNLAPRGRRREYRLYLPLYKKLLSLSLGFEPGAVIAPAPAAPGSKPWFFYGTSITQGGCASTAGSDFVSLTGRLLDVDVINFGFSGNGRGEPAMARLIREVDAEMFVLDFFANADVETLDAVLWEFLRILREKRPKTPVVISSSPAFNQALWNDSVRDVLARKRDTGMRVYLRAKDAGDQNVHFLDGSALLPAGIPGAYVDGVHPTSHGFALMAERLAPLLRAIRIGGRLGPSRK